MEFRHIVDGLSTTDKHWLMQLRRCFAENDKIRVYSLRRHIRLENLTVTPEVMSLLYPGHLDTSIIVIISLHDNQGMQQHATITLLKNGIYALLQNNK